MSFMRVMGCLLLVSSPAFAQNPVPDATYGPGGSKTTSSEKLNDGSMVETIEIRDKGGQLRERIKTTVDPNRNEVVERDWYDAQGVKTKQTMTKKNAAGHQYYSREDDFKDGVLESGAIVEEENGKLVQKRFNKQTQRYEPVDPANEPFDLFKVPGFEQDLEITDSLYGGVVFVWEDSSPRFWASGVSVSYAHKLISTWGFAADLQWTIGEQHGVTYRKVQGFVGVVFGPHSNRRLYFAPRLLGGFSHLDGVTSFALAAGVDVGRRVSNRLDLVGRAEYIPTFANSGVQHNVRIGGGLKMRF